jgi:hypothetical protein
VQHIPQALGLAHENSLLPWISPEKRLPVVIIDYISPVYKKNVYKNREYSCLSPNYAKNNYQLQKTVTK